MAFDGGKYSAPTKLGDNINSPHVEAKPYIAPDESYLVFSSHRPDGGKMMSRKDADGNWTAPVGINDLLGDNMISLQGISPDGRYAFLNGSEDGLFGFYWIDAAVLKDYPAGTL